MRTLAAALGHQQISNRILPSPGEFEALTSAACAQNMQSALLKPMLKVFRALLRSVKAQFFLLQPEL